MPVRIRLARYGHRNHPFYRIYVADSRAPRDGTVKFKASVHDIEFTDALFALQQEDVRAPSSGRTNVKEAASQGHESEFARVLHVIRPVSAHFVLFLSLLLLLPFLFRVLHVIRPGHARTRCCSLIQSQA